MNIIARYTRANIKSNRSRIPLIVLCIAVAVFMFGASIVMPKLVRNFAEESTKSIYGSSDIYIAESMDNSNPVGTRYWIPQEVIDQSEYVASIFALQGTIRFANKTQTTNLIGVEQVDLNNFNKPVIEEGTTGLLLPGEMIISRHYADTNDVSVGDRCRFVYAGKFFNFKVAAIAENSGLFKWKSSNNIVVNQETIKSIIPSLPVYGMFNICVIKLKDNSAQNIEWAIDSLKKAYPDWTIATSTDFERIDTLIQNNQGPLIFCTVIVIIYCLFIILLTMEIVFSERTRQFATMKSMGASKPMQLKSIVFESLFYGALGGALGTIIAGATVLILKALPNRYLFEGIDWFYYVFMFLFGFVLSIVCSIIPATKTLKMSLRQSMLSKKASKKTMLLIQGAALIVLIVGLILAAVQPKGRYIGASPLIFSGIFISILVLVPYIFRYILLIVTKASNLKTFSTIYTQNSFLSSSLKVVSRIMFFSLFLIAFLISSVSTMQTQAESQVEVDYYSVSIGNIYDGKSELIKQELHSQNFVDKTYRVTVFEDNYYQSADGEQKIIYDLKGMSTSDIRSLFGDKIDNADSVIELLGTDRNYIIMNIKYHYIDNLEIGDEVDILIHKHNEYYNHKMIVAGFVDTIEADYYSAIMNINTLNNIMNLDNYNTVYVTTKDANVDKVVEHIQKKFGNAYVVNRFSENQNIKKESYETPINMFVGYAVVIVIMSTIFVVVGLYLALRKSMGDHKTMNILGMGSGQFVKTSFYQISYVSICSTILTVLTVLVSYKQMFNMFLMFGKYYNVVVDWGAVFLYIAITLVLTISISSIVTRVHSKNFEIHERQSDE